VRPFAAQSTDWPLRVAVGAGSLKNMVIGVPKESYPGERRVALTPAVLPSLIQSGLTVLVEAGAGVAAGHADEDFEKSGAEIIASRSEIFSAADIIVQVLALNANPPAGSSDLALMRPHQALIAFLRPLATQDNKISALAKARVTGFAVELMPRITRAQSMDALSSMSTVVGYKAVLAAAEALPKMFPMLMTAAGTIRPSRVLVLGAGVAGLMACATAKRLGAVVEATDVRPEVKEQVKSVGAKFLEVKSDESGAGEGGYAKEMSDDYKKKQAEMLAKHIAKADVVIPTALIPGRKAPILITEEHVKSMKPGTVIVDLAAEMGGNCELTEKDKDVIKHGVLIMGNSNIASTMPQDASLMFSKNVEKFLFHLTDENGFKMDMNDAITAGSLVVKGGEIMHALTKKIMSEAGGN
jgi:NAD(P) transhydrogenase subunit alpha